jgi:trehalose 6-phosphate phosphatase
VAEPRFDEPSSLADVVASLPSPLLLCTDVDGTVSEITATPGEARLLDGASEALHALAAAGVEIGVVSGRTLSELIRQFGLPRSFHLIGSHGVEFEHSAPRTEGEGALLTHVDELLGEIAARHPGAVLERKPFASALHVRRCGEPDGDAALAEAAAAVDRLHGVYVLPGHRVFEVVVREMTKPQAVAQLRRRVEHSSCVFIGDDHSDELVFASFADAPAPERAALLGIKVGAAPSVAAYRLRTPHETVRFLQALAKLVRG